MKADVEPKTPAPISRRELQMVFAGLMITMALAALDQNIVSTALPSIVSDLGGLAHLSWVVTAFMLTSAMTTPLYGKLSDMYGRKPLFYVAIGLFLLGSMLCGAAQSMLQLILFRALQGLGAGGLLTLSQTTIGDILPPRERPRYQGLFTGVWAVGSVAGPLLGGFLTSALSWRWIFYVNLPVGALALFLITVALKGRAPRVTHQLDYVGIVLLMAATSAVMLLLSWAGSEFPWRSAQTVALATTAAVLLVALIVQERRAPEPILAIDLFKNRIFCIGAGVTGINAMGLFGVGVFMSLYFQLVVGAAPYQAGLMLTPQIGGMITASILGGNIVTLTGRYKAFLVSGCALVTLSMIGLAWFSSHVASVVPIEICLFLMGGGMGLVMPNLTVAVQNSVVRDRLGAATSSISFTRTLGASIGVSLFGGLMAGTLGQAMARNAPGVDAQSLLRSGVTEIARLPLAQKAAVVSAYHDAIGAVFLAGSVVAALGFFIVLMMPEIPLGTRSKAEEQPLME